LQNWEKPLIFVTHDESIIHAFDGQGRQWLPAGEQPLRKKGASLALHVSDFLANVCERLTFVDGNVATNNECAKEACEIMKPGKNYDGWWTIKNLAKQVIKKAVPIF
jgi:ATPase subunit of ABC transporter with duplicated ATPase domains